MHTAGLASPMLELTFRDTNSISKTIRMGVNGGLHTSPPVGHNVRIVNAHRAVNEEGVLSLSGSLSFLYP